MDYLYRNLTDRNIEENEISPVNPDAVIPLPSFIRSASRGGKTSKSQYISMTSSLGTIWKWNNGNDVAIITKGNFEYCIDIENILDLRTIDSFKKSIERNKTLLIKEGLNEERYPGLKYQEWAFIFSSSSKEIVFQKQTIDREFYEVIDCDILNKGLELFTPSAYKFCTIFKNDHKSIKVKNTEKLIDDQQDYLTEKLLELNKYYKDEVKEENFIDDYDKFITYICRKAFPATNLASWKNKSLGYKTLKMSEAFTSGIIKEDPELWIDEKLNQYLSTHKKIKISSDLLKYIITDDFYKELERNYNR